MEEIFSGIFSDKGKLYTKNLVPAFSVYGERLEQHNGVEFRQWIPQRSKLGAAIRNGLKEVPIQSGSKILYLGAAEGTTASHISDIIGENGLVAGIDISEKCIARFVQLCEQRGNILPLLADASKPEEYAAELEGIKFDLIYQDISQKNQAEIFDRNAAMFLESGRHGMIAIKARSISQKAKTSEIFSGEIKILEEEFDVEQVVPLAPFEKDHVFVLCRKK